MSPTNTTTNEEEEYYDSEEERYRERLQNMQRTRQVQADASRQMETLRKHRAEQEKLKRMASSAARLRESTGPWDVENDSKTDDLAAVEENEERWEALDAELAASESLVITLKTLPWPPFEEDMPRYLSALAKVMGSGTCNGDRLKKAYTKACLRYHPDKFQSKYGRFVPKAELELVMSKVERLMMEMNSAFRLLKAEHA